MSDYLSMSLEINRLAEIIAEKDKEIERLNKVLTDINKIRTAKIRSLEDIISEMDCDL